MLLLLELLLLLARVYSTECPVGKYQDSGSCLMCGIPRGVAPMRQVLSLQGRTGAWVDYLAFGYSDGTVREAGVFSGSDKAHSVFATFFSPSCDVLRLACACDLPVGGWTE